MQNSIPTELTDTVKRCRRALIATHLNPDGDALGSAAALAHIVLGLGAEARLLLPGTLPEFLAWLPLPCPVVASIAELGPWVPDTIMLADCGEAKRAGSDLDALFNGKGAPAPGWETAVTVNIDHHVSNPQYAAINWVESWRSATGELVGLLAEELGIPLTDGLGQALYLAIVSDTGHFTFANTSPASLEMAARIVRNGLDIAEFTARYENTWTIARMHLWGRLLAEVTLHASGAVACSVVPEGYLAEFGLKKADLEGFASWLRRLRGVRVGLFVREDGPGHSKASLRSMGDVDVQAVAAVFGGGGHTAAAGAELAMEPQQAAEAILAELIKHM